MKLIESENLSCPTCIIEMSMDNFESMVSNFIPIDDRRNIKHRNMELSIKFTNAAKNLDHASGFNRIEFSEHIILFIEPHFAFDRARTVVKSENKICGMLLRLRENPNKLHCMDFHIIYLVGIVVICCI